MLNLLGSSARRRQIAVLHGELIRRAREPVFFTSLGVPDTIDGRFDVLTLHAFLLLERLQTARADSLSQGLTDTLFLGLDEGLREMGTGDMGMGRKMKSMGNAFYGRMKAYGEAGDEAALAQAIIRNIYRDKAGHEDAAARMSAYAMRAKTSLAGTDILNGVPDFGALPQA